MTSGSRSPVLSYGSAVVSIALATWLALLLEPIIGATYPYATFSLAVLAVAWYGGVGPALTAVALGALATNFFLIDPRGAFHTPPRAELAGLALYLGTSIGIALLGGGMRSAVSRAESEVRKRLSQLRLSVENSPGSTAMFDTEMRYLVTSARWRADFGLEAQPIVGRSHYEIFPEVPERWKDIHSRCLTGATEKKEEDSFLRADGSVQWLRWEIRPWRYERDVIGGIVMYTEDITARKRAEQEVAARELRYRSFVDALGQIVTVTGPNGEPRPAPSWAAFTGQTVEETAARGLHASVHPDDVASLLEQWKNALAAKQPAEFAFRLRRADGAWRHMRARAVPVKNEEGIVVEWVAVNTDETQRILAEDALRTSEERMRLLIEGAQDYAIYMLDAKGTIITWNLGAERMMGYTAEEIIGQNVSRFYSATDIANAVPARELQLAIANGRLEDEGWRVRKDESRFWANGVLSALMDGSKVRGFSKVVRDVTERRQTEELLRSVLYNALDGIASIDAEGRIQSFNRAGERLFGYPAAEVIGQNIRLLLPESSPGALDGYFGDTMLTGESMVIGVGAELRGRRKDGAMFPLEMAVTEFRLDNERHFTAVLRDLTGQNKLQEQLRQSQKLEAFGQLAGGVAHDFNNLLTVIAGDSESLLAELGPDDPHRDLVSDIRDAGTRATSLTRQLLAFSRRQVLEPKVVDINEVLSNTSNMLRRLIGEDIVLSSALDPHPAPVRVDPGQIEQVILNLAVNARDAMPLGGKLTVETHNVNWTEPPVGADADWRPGQYVMFSMTDTGVGMTREIKARIFEPFFTTKGQGKGTGLGLATVFGIIKQSEGFINVYSEPGIGTSFKIFLPAIAPRTPLSGARSASPLASGGSETILLVEDEESVRRVAKRILSSRGYKVIEACNGQEALKAIDLHNDPIHMVITDVVMPEMSGRQLAEAVRARRVNTRVLFMSGYTDDAVVRHGIIHEKEAFIQKPFSPDSLSRKVREVLDGSV
jgi:hypothetical protein